MAGRPRDAGAPDDSPPADPPPGSPSTAAPTPPDAGRQAAANAAPPVPDEALTALVEAARSARAHAYAPYSNYPVGAAVLTDDGRTFTGCNVENAMYGATVCAERVALWTAVAAGARRIVAVAVVTDDGGTPCGFCRQVLWEFGGGEAVVAMADQEGRPRQVTLGGLLPQAWHRTAG